MGGYESYTSLFEYSNTIGIANGLIEGGEI